MNRLLVTGLATGYDARLCQVCNYDFDWIINNPALLLWADRLLVPNSIWDVIKREAFPFEKEIARCCRLIFELADAEGLIEIIDHSPIVEVTLREGILDQIDRDVRQIMQLFPDRISLAKLDLVPNETHNEIILDGHRYCAPYLWSIYGSLILARMWNANCLFNANVLHYLRYKFGISALPGEAATAKFKSFMTIFKTYLPNQSIIPAYALYAKKECLKCTFEQRCSDGYLAEVEERVSSLLKWREYDEFYQARAVINKIVSKHDSSEELVEPTSVAAEFRDIQKQLGKRIRSVFPKVKRWTHVAAILSVPLTVTGLAGGSSFMSLAGASLFSISQLGKECLEMFESKYRWLGFLQNMAKPNS